MVIRREGLSISIDDKWENGVGFVWWKLYALAQEHNTQAVFLLERQKTYDIDQFIISHRREK